MRKLFSYVRSIPIKRNAKKNRMQKEFLVRFQSVIEILKRKIRNGMRLLKSFNFRSKYRRNAALCVLPWHIIIGPPNSGKSTLLHNSGLIFSFSSRRKIRLQGFDEIKNCDWWFADRAVILDTTGHYTLENCDRQEWLAFLSLLKKTRPKLPINGILVTIDLVEILKTQGEEIDKHVKMIRKCIEELYNKLGYVIPVYLIFTKCDLIKGFNAFFRDLSETERQQVWGICLSERDYVSQLHVIYAKLSQLRLHKLSVEFDPVYKAELYDFPEQFRLALPRLEKFIHVLSMPNIYQENMNLLGIYFTSVAQENINIDQGSSKRINYFIKDIFLKVLPHGNCLAVKTIRRLHWIFAFRIGSCIIGTIIVSITFLAYNVSFTNNALLIRKGEKISTILARNLILSGNSLQLNANTLLMGYQYYEHLLNYEKNMPLHLRLGLYRGNTQIKPFRNMLLSILSIVFFYPVRHCLEKKLIYYANSWKIGSNKERHSKRGAYYMLLKAYLMLKFTNKLDVEQTAGILSVIWNQLLSGSHHASNNIYLEAMKAKKYVPIISFYLNNLKQGNVSTHSWPINVSLVEQARKQLYSPSNIKNLYAQIISQSKIKLSSITLHDMIDNYGADLLFSDDSVPGIFTLNGWHTYMQTAIKKINQIADGDDWVMNASLPMLITNTLLNNKLYKNRLSKKYSKSKDHLYKKIRSLYFADYYAEWYKFLKSIKIEHFDSLDDAANQLIILSSIKGPLVQLIEFAYKNKILDRFSQVSTNVDDMMKNYLLKLAAVGNELQRLVTGADPERDAQKYAAKILSESGEDLALYRSMMAANSLINQFDNVETRSALKSVLLQPIREAWFVILEAAARNLEKLWRNEIAINYKEVISNRFPFNHFSAIDANLPDVMDFFAPKQGVLWTFVRVYLKPYLYFSGNSWHERKWLGIGTSFSKQFLAILTHADQISSSLFANNKKGMNFTYQVYPIPTPGISQIIFSVDGATYRYRNGPQEWKSLRWPGNSDQTSELTAISAQGISPHTLQVEGAWGLFRLLAQGHIIFSQHSTYKIIWKLSTNKKNYYVQLKLRLENKDDAIKSLLLNQFILPEVIFSKP